MEAARVDDILHARAITRSLPSSSAEWTEEQRAAADRVVRVDDRGHVQHSSALCLGMFARRDDVTVPWSRPI